MSRISQESPQFYLTAPAPCPYLGGKFERKVFTHLAGEHAPQLNDILTQGGFRRSQNIAYQPACEACKACVSVRVVVDEYSQTRSHKRAWRRNQDLSGEERDAHPTSEQYSLFRDYVDTRHGLGGMAEMSVLDYAMMVEDSHVNTLMIEYRQRGPDSGLTGKGEGALVAAGLTDRMSDGLSMVYSFFDPAFRQRSIGKFMIVDHIERARRLGLQYVYLGYWVEGSRKMDYKAEFLPQERLGENGWMRVEEG